MKIQFKCTMHTDVILSQNSASEGNRPTLDFIPGNNFLGIVAGRLYNKLSPEEQQQLFHSGKVRFGDAHPAVGPHRSLRVPASLYCPKLKTLTDGECYIYHLYNRQHDIREKKIENVPQLKQCRTGFYSFVDKKAIPAVTWKNIAVKSAYDQQTRASKEGQMFTYESIRKGKIYYFEIDLSDDLAALKEAIIDSLTGMKRVGKSRSSQYGQVYIEEFSYEEIVSGEIKKDTEILVYADGRLIFLDQYGQPTFEPAIGQLLGEHFSGLGSINWAKSQIRTFRYAPWNSKRHAYDTDRCGIEKGSVFVVELKDEPADVSPVIPDYTGYYKNEGFGKIIVNPVFLCACQGQNGRWIYEVSPPEEPAITEQSVGVSSAGDLINSLTVADKVVLSYLQSQETLFNNQLSIYKAVNTFIDTYKHLFLSSTAAFAAQWSSVRSIASQYTDQKELRTALFEEESGYLNKGIEKEKWDKEKRRDTLMKFYDSLEAPVASPAMVTLASAMSKICSMVPVKNK